MPNSTAPRCFVPIRTLAALLLSAGAPPLGAQWSTDPALNTEICVQPGDQTVPQLAVDGEGGTWIGWFDNRGGSYAVYAQHLRQDGAASFPANGLPVSSHPQNSFLIGWDLQASGDGDALLAFTDVRAGGDTDVYAYRLTRGGAFAWGPDGVPVSANADFDANPVIAELSDGAVAVAWARIPSSGAGAIHVRRYSPAGAFLHEVVIPGGAGEQPSFCALAASDSGSFIVQWIRNTASFSSPRHVRAQKFDAAGAALWGGGAPVVVFDQTSVPIAHQPLLVSDGAGGAWLAWHAAPVSTFTTSVQHLTPGGVESFPHNGVSVAVEPGVQQLSPSLTVLPGGDAIVVFNRRNGAQSQWGVGAQRISASGARLWTNAGVSVDALDAKNESFERVVRFGDGALVAFFDQPQTPLPNSRVRGARLAGDGSLQWLPGTLSISSNLAGKDDLEVAIDRTGVLRAVWRDERNDFGDIYAQNLNPDGALGGASSCVSNPFCLSAANSVGPGGAQIRALGSTSLGWGDFELSVSNCPANANGRFFYGPQAIAPAPFFSGWLCLTQPFVRLPPVTADASGVAAFALDLTAPNPAAPITAGTAWGFQFWYRDPSFAGPPTNTSDGVWASFCH